MNGAWNILRDKAAAADTCGAHIVGKLSNALDTKPSATLALSGGTTPKPMFQFLARSGLDWSRIHLFWVDERPVPPDHAESNYRLVEQSLIQPARIGEGNVHRICGELEPQEAARRYRDELLSSAALTTGDLPQFDVVHLGMGPDAHTASLFPGEPLIDDRVAIAAAIYVEKIPQWRITLLPRVLLAARHIALLVTGEDKGPALRRVFADEYIPLQFPAQLIAHNATNATWFFDEAAARSLKFA